MAAVGALLFIIAPILFALIYFALLVYIASFFVMRGKRNQLHAGGGTLQIA